MDLVNRVYFKNSTISEPIVGHNFQEEWSKLLNIGFMNNAGGNNDRKIAGKLNMDSNSKEFQALKKVCSAENLSCEGIEVKVLNKKSLRESAIPNIQKESNVKDELATYSIQKKELIQRNLDSQYRAALLAQWRYVHNPEQSVLLPVSSRTPSTYLRLKHQTVFIVQVYRPVSFEDSHGIKKSVNLAKRLCHVIAVLGEQKLTTLRDKIICCSDQIALGEFSKKPEDAATSEKAKNIMKSAFFYIGDVFYNDLRNEKNIDYSKVLIKYAETHSKTPAKLHSKSMDEMEFRNLKLQLGYPYLFMHQGNCEHVIVFSDIRLLSPKESQFTSDYPMVCRIGVKRRTVCMICETFTAKWITHGNKRLSTDPYFFCDMCFYQFNYTAEKEKIGEFSAYCYVDRSSIT